MNWSQLKTLLWLRWKLSWNQLRKGRSMNLVLAVVATIGGYTLALGSAIGGFLLGWKLLGQADPRATLLTLDLFTGLFLFSWVVGLLNELQRSEVIDIQRLMHLPISLPQLFCINYIASHFTFSLIAAVPALIALSLGLALSVGWQMVLLIPLALSFLVLVTSWTYCVRGWLVALMVNQRRRRAITAALTIAVILIAQAPNIYFNLMRPGGGRRASRERLPTSLANYGTSPASELAHVVAPPLWLPHGALSLRQGNLLPAIGETLGLSLLAGLGLSIAYRNTRRFYSGDTRRRTVTASSEPAAVPRPAPAGPQKRMLVEWDLPWLRTDTAGLALASLRGMLRAPEMKMMILGPLVMMVLFYGIFFVKNRSSLPAFAADFAPTGLILLLFFSMIQVLLNQFGLDRNGFRSLVLLPIPRKQMLLAKNLAFAPFVLPPAFLALVVLPFLMPITGFALVAGLFQALTMYFLLNTLGNVYSIGAPFRINVGSLKPTKNPPKIVFLLFLSHLLFPVISLPVLIPPAVDFLAHRAGWAVAVPLNLLLSAFSLICVALVYLGSLEPLGEWLQRREKAMLNTLTQEVE